VGQVKSGKWKTSRVAGLAASWHLPGAGLNILVLLVATSAPQGERLLVRTWGFLDEQKLLGAVQVTFI